MRKNIIKWVLLVTVICAISWMANVSFKKVQIAKSIKEKFNRLPEFLLITLDSSSIDVSDFANRPLVLIYFNSECDHCQNEAEEIKNSIGAFSKSTLVFMSSEPLRKIKAFKEAVALRDQENIFFTKISSKEAFSAFGTLAVPHVFIYGPDKVLKKEFKGQTKAKAILKYLKPQ